MGRAQEILCHAPVGQGPQEKSPERLLQFVQLLIDQHGQEGEQKYP
jgi:hypothetical protein